MAGGAAASATAAAAAVALMGAGPVVSGMIPKLSGFPSASFLSYPLPGTGGAGSASPSAASPLGGSATISQRHVKLIKAYGRVYCCHVNIPASRLDLYRFFTDTISLQHSFELCSTDVDVSVVDNVIVVHHLDTGVALLFDVAAAAAVAAALGADAGAGQAKPAVPSLCRPVTNPLPLAVLAPPPPPPREPLPASAPLSPPGEEQLMPQHRRREGQPLGPRSLRCR